MSEHVVTVRIGRTSGPCNDLEAIINCHPSEVNAIADTLAAVNAVSNGVEGWWYQVSEDKIMVPVCKR